MSQLIETTLAGLYEVALRITRLLRDIQDHSLVGFAEEVEKIRKVALDPRYSPYTAVPLACWKLEGRLIEDLEGIDRVRLHVYFDPTDKAAEEELATRTEALRTHCVQIMDLIEEAKGNYRLLFILKLSGLAESLKPKIAVPAEVAQEHVTAESTGT